MKWIVGIAAMVLGVFLVIKTEWFIRAFGSSEWAEVHMGTSGGTRLLYKLIGLTFFFGALLGMTGLLGTIFLSVFGRLFGL